MKQILFAILVIMLLTGCEESVKTTNTNDLGRLNSDLAGCKSYIWTTSTSNAVYVVRCPRSDSVSVTRAGKSPTHSVVIESEQ